MELGISRAEYRINPFGCVSTLVFLLQSDPAHGTETLPSTADADLRVMRSGFRAGRFAI